MPLHDDLLTALPEWIDRRLGTVIHVGAGNGRVMDSYATTVRPNRLVLVEGDPIAAAELSRRAAGLPWVSVQAQPVAPAAGELTWNRYNWPALNGPWEASDLRTMYPSLRPIGSNPVHAVSLQSVIESLSLSSNAEAANLLILDTPGQQTALIESLSANALGAFDAVIVRGPAGTDGVPVPEMELLSRSGYRCVPASGTGGTSATWPIWRYVRDPAASRAAEWEQRAKGVQAELETARAQFAEMATRLSGLEGALAQARQAAATHASRGEAVTAERDEIASQRDAWRAQHEASERALHELRQAHAQLQSTHAKQTQEAAAAAQAVAEQGRRQAEELNARIALEAALAAAHEASATDAARAATLALQHEEATARHQASEQALHELQQAHAQLGEAHAAQAREAAAAAEAAAEQGRRQSEELNVRIAALETALAAAREALAVHLARATTLALQHEEATARHQASEQALHELQQAHAQLGEAHAAQAREAAAAAEGAAAQGRRQSEELNGRIAALETALAAAREASAVHSARATTLALQHEEANARHQSLQKALQELQQICSQLEDAQTAQARRHDEDQKAAQRTVHLAVQMQNLREADLKDLQGRYRATLERLQSQHELLTKLGQRLSAANDHFLQLANARQLAVTAASPRRERNRASEKVAATRSVGRSRAGAKGTGEGQS